MSNNITRRNFIKRAAAAGAAIGFPTIIPARALGQDGAAAAGSRVTLGFIGLGRHGLETNLRDALGAMDAQVVALCDCDAAHLAAAKAEAADAKTYADWRELIARDDIDAIVISTPDHWHAPMALAALRAGKDVLCENPLSLTVREGRLVSDAAARGGRICMVASEFRAMTQFHQAAQLVRNRRIGKLQTVRMAMGSSPEKPGDPTPQPVPQGLDYEMWLGPAPWAPYTADRVHYNFRWILDYSGGQLTDWGGHFFDLAHWAMDTEKSGPVSVEGEGEFLSEGLFNTAQTFSIEYEYAGGVRVIASDQDEAVGTDGAIRFEGDQGWLCADYYGGLTASSPQLLKSVILPEETHLYTNLKREVRNFIDCVKSRREPYYPVEAGHRAATVAHLGNIAMQLGRKLEWDPAREDFKNDAEASRMLGRVMREPWTL